MTSAERQTISTSLIVWLCVLSALVAVGGFPLLLAAADPEGRGGNIILVGIAGVAVGIVGFAGFGLWALVRWMH